MMEDLLFPVSIAPMMDYTDRHYRMLMRLITKRSILYTEMISTGAILHGKRADHLEFSPAEKPLVLQVGGDDPYELAECTRIAADYGYDEINLNAGCPSERVQKGSFGAALMAKPKLVGEIVSAMHKTRTIPVSVKCRVGIDGSKVGMPTITDYESLKKFAHMVFENGARRLSIHARIAILGGLSPKENREIPPLQYSLVYKLYEALKTVFPNNIIEINGGISSIEEIKEQLTHMDGVMLGRIAIEQPMMLQSVDSLFAKKDFSATALGSTKMPQLSRKELCLQYAEYIERVQHSIYTHHAIRHLMPMYNGLRGARKWRQSLSLALQHSTPALQSVQEALKYSEVEG